MYSSCPDIVAADNEKLVAQAEAEYQRKTAEINAKDEKFEETTSAEVGNIFKLKYKYSEPLGLKFIDEDNTQKIVYMGCYGIGVSRLMGVIAEKFADDKGLVWPEAVAPFKYYLVGIGEKGSAAAEEIYAGHEDEVFFDDRNLRPGEKFADSELMGMPYRIVVSDKTLAENKAEITTRATGETKLVDLKEIFM